MAEPVGYSDAGVDLEAADRSVGLIAARVAATHGPEVLEGIGGFGGLFRFDVAAWRDPVLVSSADGVGTKVELARQLDRLDTIGQDLVAMVVDDLVAVGARPLFFNDYLAVGRLDPERVATIPYAVNGNQLELVIPRAALGLTPDCKVALDFKWADNIQKRGDIAEFFIHGDVAPERRFNYRYKEYCLR
jgi:hypothetical protein